MLVELSKQKKEKIEKQKEQRKEKKQMKQTFEKLKEENRRLRLLIDNYELRERWEEIQSKLASQMEEFEDIVEGKEGFDEDRYLKEKEKKDENNSDETRL